MSASSEILPAVEVEPRQAASGSVVWLHGLGASGHDFEDIVPLLHLDDVRFVFPHAPRRPVTINGGLIMPAWYDILGLAPGSAGEQPRHVRESAELIEALLERERQRGIPSSRTVLAGFSQGGAMALHVGVRHAHRLAGIMVLSAYEVLTDTREAEASDANASTPMLLCHGVYDDVVLIERGLEARRAFDTPDRQLTWEQFPHGHEVSFEEIEVIRDWLGQRLPATRQH